ncbi:unnamed protein product [Protopolystoma xenopodis]|uniref:Uncharacterized protein n=1 Tax=Protopolystoma xenopodis TaxID=117903 RepID=A0A3S4ZI24_9PLAT|nr:unnamed protein product [Protopolystoma xenopodis]
MQICSLVHKQTQCVVSDKPTNQQTNKQTSRQTHTHAEPLKERQMQTFRCIGERHRYQKPIVLVVPRLLLVSGTAEGTMFCPYLRGAVMSAAA